MAETVMTPESYSQYSQNNELIITASGRRQYLARTFESSAETVDVIQLQPDGSTRLACHLTIPGRYS